MGIARTSRSSPVLDLARRAEDKTETLGRALHELGPTRAVMVGDRSFDIVAAHAHGLPAIGVTWGIGTHKELHDAGAERIIGHPDDLPAAAAVLLGDSMSATVLADFSLYNLSPGCNHLSCRRPRRDLRARRRLPARAAGSARSTCRSCTT